MSSLITLALFLLAKVLYKKFRCIIFIPVFFAVVGGILIISLTPLSFDRYFLENRSITFMLGPAVVSLGVLLYKQLPIIRSHFKSLLLTILCSSCISALSVVVLTGILDLPTKLSASLLPLGITTPIAIEVVKPLEGNPSITSVVVIGVGLFGNLVSPYILRWFKVDWDPAKGLALGQSSHGIGTARAVEISESTGTFSGLAMTLNGVITVFTAPLIWSIFH